MYIDNSAINDNTNNKLHRTLWIALGLLLAVGRFGWMDADDGEGFCDDEELRVVVND